MNYLSKSGMRKDRPLDAKFAKNTFSSCICQKKALPLSSEFVIFNS